MNKMVDVTCYIVVNARINSGLFAGAATAFTLLSE